jgi:hypothetical protein
LIFGRVVRSSQFSGFSQNQLLQFIMMSETSMVVATVGLYVSRGSATAAISDLKLGSGGAIIVPSSVFLPSPAATLGVARIGPDSFHSKRITSILIPRHVQILCSSCFLFCKSLSSISFETDSELTRIESNAFADSSIQSITIPRHVQILCSSCFSACKSLSSISFETDSELTRIESKAFFCCSSLKSITIPQNVEFVDGSAFTNIYNISVSIASNNLHFVVKSHFILDSSNTKLIRYFGTESNIFIPRHVQILCSSCFSSCKLLSSISFETHSKLTRIEARVCWNTNIFLVVVPRSTSFIAGDAFPRCCTVTLAE